MYDRIAANRRKTVLLLVVFVLISLPFAAVLATYLQVVGFEAESALHGMFSALSERLRSGDWGWQEGMRLSALLLALVGGVSILITLAVTLLIYCSVRRRSCIG